MWRKLIKTDMVKRYSFKLFIRVAIFLFVFVLYIINKELIKEILTMEFSFGIMNCIVRIIPASGKRQEV